MEGVVSSKTSIMRVSRSKTSISFFLPLGHFNVKQRTYWQLNRKSFEKTTNKKKKKENKV